MMNKKGAVSTYRFLAMYILIGIVIGAVTSMGISLTDTTHGYDLSGSQDRIIEQGNEKDTNIEQGDEVVKSDQLSLTSSWGNENGMGRSVVEVLYRGFLPTGVIPWGYTPTPLEEQINWIIVIFRFIIMIFAGYEIYQIIIKTKVT